jgi:hypothetical protein
MPHFPVVPPFRYGETKWDDYLRDVQVAVFDATRAQIKSSREASKAVTGRLHELQVEMNWGFTLLHDQMEAQLRQLQANERIKHVEAESAVLMDRIVRLTAEYSDIVPSEQQRGGATRFL